MSGTSDQKLCDTIFWSASDEAWNTNHPANLERVWRVASPWRAVQRNAILRAFSYGKRVGKDHSTAKYI
jgi:hypothetical protein